MFKKVQDDTGKWSFKPFENMGLIYPDIEEYLIMERSTGHVKVLADTDLQKYLTPDQYKIVACSISITGEYRDDDFHMRIHRQKNREGLHHEIR